MRLRTFLKCFNQNLEIGRLNRLRRAVDLRPITAPLHQRRQETRVRMTAETRACHVELAGSVEMSPMNDFFDYDVMIGNTIPEVFCDLARLNRRRWTKVTLPSDADLEQLINV